MARCNYTGRRGQCTRAAIDCSEFCQVHSKESDRMRGYRISDPKLTERLGHHNDEESFKTVEQEIILLRSLIEERLDLASSKAEKEAAFSVVTPMIGQVNKLIDNLARLRRTSSTVVGKAALHKLGSQIVSIVIDELSNVPDRDRIIDSIAEKISDAIANTKNETDD